MIVRGHVAVDGTSPTWTTVTGAAQLSEVTTSEALATQLEAWDVDGTIAERLVEAVLAAVRGLPQDELPVEELAGVAVGELERYHDRVRCAIDRARFSFHRPFRRCKPDRVIRAGASGFFVRRRWQKELARHEDRESAGEAQREQRDRSVR